MSDTWRELDLLDRQLKYDPSGVDLERARSLLASARAELEAIAPLRRPEQVVIEHATSAEWPEYEVTLVVRTDDPGELMRLLYDWDLTATGVVCTEGVPLAPGDSTEVVDDTDELNDPVEVRNDDELVSDNPNWRPNF